MFAQRHSSLTLYSNYQSNSIFQNDSKFGPYNQFGDNCHFGANCNFQSHSQFGKKCSFGPGCKFEPHCSFEKNCKFGNFCSFSTKCNFGIHFSPNQLQPIIYENLLINLTDYSIAIIDTIINFIGSESNCEFGDNINVGSYCSIGPKSIIGEFAKLELFCEIKENCTVGLIKKLGFGCRIHPSTQQNMNVS
jgi:UDP-3-O-[3-hydroxymyristoyl] glucosamine N-acyltransferase